MKKFILLFIALVTLSVVKGEGQNLTQPYTLQQPNVLLGKNGYPVFDYNLETAQFVTRDKLANMFFGAASSAIIYFAVYSKTKNIDEATIWAFIISNFISITKQSVIAIHNNEKFNFCHTGAWMVGSGGFLISVNITFEQGFKFALSK